MANVIDRLRVQGNPAPRNLPSQPLSGLRREGGKSGEERGQGPQAGPPTMQFVVSHSHLQSRESSGGRNMNQAARRLEHLQRIQMANQGLSSMDVRQPDLSGKQFLLRGKPASADTLLHRQQQNQQQQQQQQNQQQQQQQEWTSASAKSGKSAHAVLTRAQPKGVTENGAMQPTRAELREGAVTNGNGTTTTTTTTNTTNNNNNNSATAPASHPLPSSLRPPFSASATSYFLLANPHTLHPANSRSAQPSSRARDLDTRARQGSSGLESPGARVGRRPAKRQNSAGSAASFELTGHQMVTPRSTTGLEDGLSFREFYTRSPRQRSGLRDAKYSALRDHRSPGLKDATTEQPPVDPQSLSQCLHVQQSTHPDSTTEVHKHLSQFSRAEVRVNYNNPYRQTRSKERRSLPESERRYIFDSVASYIHFNKIYPNSAPKEPPGGSPIKSAPQRSGFQGMAIKEGVPKVPHLTGFPKHCTDTILLRMMFELNRPGAVHGIGLSHQAAGAPSMKSTDSTKYSDIGRHRDLDEFTIRGETPSLTSHRQQHPPSSSRGGGGGGGAPISLPSTTTTTNATGKEEKRKGNKEAEADGERITEEEEEEDTSTLITATTPGRPTAPDDDDDDADDADDEASQWNVHGGGDAGGGGGGKGRGGRGGRKGRTAMGRVVGEGEEGYVSSDSSVGPLADH